jgi:hypothetical protein
MEDSIGLGFTVPEPLDMTDGAGRSKEDVELGVR